MAGRHVRAGAPVREGANYRPDIQGLRAVAVLLVVFYHLFPSRLSGGFVGVDVFFVISGYVITGHLARSRARTGKLRLVEFYARRARRLVPAATLVLVATWVVSRFVLPITQLPDTAQQIRASALYVQNWTLANNAVSYLKSDNAATPVQHFWSLSVEEQFYFVWPLLFILAAGIVALLHRRRTTRTVSVGRVVAVLAAAVVVASLWYSVHETDANPAAAYFVTPTRMWELGIGGVLALIPERLLRPVARVGPLAWVGLALVIGSAVELNGNSAFPGWVALVPTGGALLLIACGSHEARWSPAWLTSVRPMVFLGDLSYSLYLWHWPVIVLWQAERQTTGHALSLRAAAVVLAISLVLSYAGKVLVEDRFRFARVLSRRRWLSLATVTAAVIPVTLVSIWIADQPGPYTPQVDSAHPGGAVLAAGAGAVSGPGGSVAPKSAPRTSTPAPTPTTATSKSALVPPLAQAATDYEVASNDNCQASPQAVTPKVCVFGDQTSPTKTVALVGDSAAGQWSSALAELAKKQHWKLVAITHSSCPWTATTVAETGHATAFTPCLQWGKAVLSMLETSVRPDVVITSDRPTNGLPGHQHTSASVREQIGAGMAVYWRALAAHHIPVVGIRESPEMGQDIPTCLARRGNTIDDCSVSASSAIYRNTALQTAAAKSPTSTLIDMNRFICETTHCSPVVGNVIVYRDAHHLTNTYSLTLEPFLAAELHTVKALT